MRDKYGENYQAILTEHRSQTVMGRYGGYSGMYNAATSKRNSTMLDKYGVKCPAQIAGHGKKCAKTKMDLQHIIIVKKQPKVSLVNLGQPMNGIDIMQASVHKRN